MNVGTGAWTGESVDSTLPLLGADGRAYLLHTVTQTDTGSATAYRRLFANIYR